MEKYTMFMDQKNQYSENEYTTQSNLQIIEIICSSSVKNMAGSLIGIALNL